MFFQTIVALYLIYSVNTEDLTFKNPIVFPYSDIQGPFIGLFVAISLPLDIPDYNIFFSYNIEANYNLPQNETEFTYPPIISKRSWDRKYIYDVLEFKLNSHGYPGKSCLLRTICEAAQFGMDESGVLGDLFHIIFSPSTSTNPNLPDVYEKAENYGKTRNNCEKYEKKCHFSLLDLITWIGNLYHK